MNDDPTLDVQMIGVEFTPNLTTIAFGTAVQMLRLVAASDGLHGFHPEVVGEGADGMDGLFEGHFDFEAPAVELNNRQGRELPISGHEDEATPVGVHHPHETDEAAGGTPEQVLSVVANGFSCFTIDRTWSRGKQFGLREQAVETEFGAKFSGLPAASFSVARRWREKRHGVGFDPTDEMMAVTHELHREFAASVEGVRHDVTGSQKRQAQQAGQEFIHQSALIAIGGDHALVNAGGNGNGQGIVGPTREQGDGLAGVTHDESGFGVGSRLLMKEFTGGHLAAFLADLDPVDHNHQPVVDANQAGKMRAEPGSPKLGQRSEATGGSVKEVQESVVTPIVEG